MTITTDIMWALHVIDTNDKYLLTLYREGQLLGPRGEDVRLHNFYSVFKMGSPIREIAAVGNLKGEYGSKIVRDALRVPVRVEFIVEEHDGEDCFAEIKIRLHKTDEEPKPIR